MIIKFAIILVGYPVGVSRDFPLKKPLKISTKWT